MENEERKEQLLISTLFFDYLIDGLVDPCNVKLNPYFLYQERNMLDEFLFMNILYMIE